MKACIWSSPSMNERFEIRSVWSTKRNYGSQTAAVFVSPRETGPLRSPTSLSPLPPPGGRGKGFPRTADAVPLRSAFGLRMLFLSRHHPPSARLTAAQPSRPRIPIGLNASHSRTDLSSVPSIPVFGTPGPVLSGQVSSKTPFYAFCVATCPNKGSLCLDLFCVITGNMYL